MKSLVLISLLVLICSKNSVIEYGKEYTFDKSNNQFEFTAEQDGLAFIHISYEGSLNLRYVIYDPQSGENAPINKPGLGRLHKVENATKYTVMIQYPDSNLNGDDTGKIWINPSWNKIKIVDLTKQYEWKFNMDIPYSLEESLVYSIDNASKNVTFKFTYSKDSLKDLPNPFTVCHGTDCKNITEYYDIVKGESYKIYARVQKLNDGIYGDRYFFPKYKFGDKEGDKPDPSPTPSKSVNLISNLWVISLLLLLIL